ncbi:pyridoxal-phosphate dependent enzyme [Phyllobacterium sp. SB3]|uniref:pyridoxal-phosphate dependent enzyme n=1 Tax=Phyllobacterium sp. SB3 TaxID=3156073 RepID=UPI0032AF7A2B
MEVVRTRPDNGLWASEDFVAPDITLGEGKTPLRSVRSSMLGANFKGRLFLKDETRNPSGSFKDRLVAAAMTQARAFGAPGVICASSGNAGAATACYAANADIPCVIVCPEATPDGKLLQIEAYGAELVRVPGHYGHSFAHAKRLAEKSGYANLTTTYLNPYGVDAARLVGQEIHKELDEVPDWVLVPTGSGPLVKGVFQGFMDVAGKVPRLVAVQAEGCAPIVKAFVDGQSKVTAWGQPTTFASGISDPLVGYEDEGTYTLGLVRQSGGKAASVSDSEIRVAMSRLARHAAVLAEPTGASSLAAACKLLEEGTFASNDSVVCMVTGHGFKDLRAWGESLPATSSLA